MSPFCPLASTTTLARTSRSLSSHADGPRSPSKMTSMHADAFVRRDAVLARVLEQHLVELAAHDLPGLRALVRLVVPEVERRRLLAARVDELHAELLDEVALLHLLEHAEPLEHPVGLGNQRFADVEAREHLALEELDLQPLLGEQRGNGGPSGSAADDDDVWLCMLR